MLKHRVGVSLSPTTSLIRRAVPRTTIASHAGKPSGRPGGGFRGGKWTEWGWTAVLTLHGMFDHQELERRKFFQSFLFGEIIFTAFILFYFFHFASDQRKHNVR